MESQLEVIRNLGISRSRGQLLSDFTALSVPIFEFSGSITAGLTVMGRIGVLDDHFEGEPAKILKAAAMEFSVSRGYKR